MHKISAVIISFNEEAKIAKCLSSLHNLVDEIIVVDSMSTDNTEAICKNYSKVKFISHEWEGYAKQKNYANSQAKHNLILSVDADEWLSEELTNSIIEVLSSDISNTAYIMNRRNFFYNGKKINHSGWYPNRTIRLFDRRYAEWRGVLHERLFFVDSVEIIRIKGDLMHLPYESKEKHFLQVENFSNIAAQDLFEKGKRATLYHRFFKPGITFFLTYIVKLGFLDSVEGVKISYITALTNYKKYQKLFKLKKNKKKRQKNT